LSGRGGVPLRKKFTSSGKQMPASQAVNELLGGIFNAFNLLRSLPK
jgi:hypothetical protein